jgi:hypothetical protein
VGKSGLTPNSASHPKGRKQSSTLLLYFLLYNDGSKIYSVSKKICTILIFPLNTKIISQDRCYNKIICAEIAIIQGLHAEKSR